MYLWITADLHKKISLLAVHRLPTNQPTNQAQLQLYLSHNLHTRLNNLVALVLNVFYRLEFQIAMIEVYYINVDIGRTDTIIIAITKTITITVTTIKWIACKRMAFNIVTNSLTRNWVKKKMNENTVYQPTYGFYIFIHTPNSHTCTQIFLCAHQMQNSWICADRFCFLLPMYAKYEEEVNDSVEYIRKRYSLNCIYAK